VIGESNVVLPDGCWFENELAGAAWTVTDTAPIGTITLTNELTCVLDTIIVQPGDLTVTKEAIDGFVLDDDGDKIVELDADGEVEVVYRFTITNVGEGPIHLTSFDDTTFGDLLPELEGDTTLAGGESIELDMAVWLTADDFVDGLHHNVVTVTGVDDEDLELIAEAEEFIWLVDVEDVVVARPIVDDDVQRVVVADRVLTQVAAQQPAPVLPRTGASLLALLLAGAFALTAGSAMTIIPRRRKR
jgi:LPXTG-motif cell wall-anchored protein